MLYWKNRLFHILWLPLEHPSTENQRMWNSRFIQETSENTSVQHRLQKYLSCTTTPTNERSTSRRGRYKFYIRTYLRWITVIPCCIVLPINTSRSCKARKTSSHAPSSTSASATTTPWTALAANLQQNCFQGIDALPAGVIGWRTNISGVDGKLLQADKDAPLGRPKSPRRTTVMDQTAARRFSCSAPKIWNSLPQTICKADTSAAFTTQLKTFLFASAFDAN